MSLLVSLGEFFVDLFRMESTVLRWLNTEGVEEGTPLWQTLHDMGFCHVKHRTALTVFRKGQFIRLLAAPSGHRWHHYWRQKGETVGPTLDLRPAHFALAYDNIPTSLTPSLAERLRGAAGQTAQPPLPALQRPVAIGVRLTVQYVFEPQAESKADYVEILIEGGQALREKTLFERLRPHLERITSQLNPIDLRLRVAESYLASQLLHRAQALREWGLWVQQVELESVTLPDTLETMFVANQELLRQNIQHYTPEELSRMLAVQLGQGLRAGGDVQSAVPLGPLVQNSLNAPPPPILTDGQPEEPPLDPTRPPRGRLKKM